MAEAENLAGKVESAQIARTQAQMSGEARRREYEGGGAKAVAASTIHRMTAKNTSKDKDLPTMFSQQAMRNQPLFYKSEIEAIKRAETANIALGASLASKASGGATSAGAKTFKPFDYGKEISAWEAQNAKTQAYNDKRAVELRKASEKATEEMYQRQREYLEHIKKLRGKK